MRTVLLLLLTAAPALAADPLETWHDTIRRLDIREKSFLREFQNRLSRAFLEFNEEIDKALAQPESHKEAVHNYAPFRQLYGDFAALEKAKADADLDLAKSGDPGAGEALLKALLDTERDIERLEKELLDAKPKYRYYVMDQRLGVRRHGLGFRRDGLVNALAALPDAVAFLSRTALPKATRADRNKSVARRVALIDALARTGRPEAELVLLPFVPAKESSLRIAAAQAALALGGKAHTILKPLLVDPNPIVRRALLQELAAHPGDARWIPDVLESCDGTRGILREDHLRALAALSGQRFGDAPDKWKRWLEDYRAEIEAGKFKLDTVEVREAEPAPIRAVSRFYGVPTACKRVVYAIEGSSRLLVPADWDVQRTRWRLEWSDNYPNWEEDYPSHRTIVMRQLGYALRTLVSDARFDVVSREAVFSLRWLDKRKLLKPTPRNRRDAIKHVERVPGRGWAAQLHTIMEAARLTGLAPGREDDFPKAQPLVVYLLGSGDPSGGRYMMPEAAVAAFRRFNRFRRITVHAIRILNEGEASETFMKGIAAASGGTYLWARKPPR